MQVPLVVDRRSTSSLHRQIYDGLREGIQRGRFHAGERMPSSRALAEALSVSRNTVVAAYDQLIAEGYLEAVRGVGTIVCASQPDERAAGVAVSGGAAMSAGHPRLSRYAAQLEADPAYIRATPGVVDLSNLGPDLNAFPFAIWRQLLARHLRNAAADVFDYTGQPAGHDGLREHIASYLSRSRAVQCTAEQVIIVSGSQQALDLCARLLLNPGDAVAVEEPGYPRARQLFVAHDAVVHAVPVDAEGIAVDTLDPRARLVYTTPSHQFPTGVVMSLARRRALVDWARRHGAVIVEDDYDSEHRYVGAPLPAVQGLSRDVPVIYVGTFSKVMFPALRIGYLVVPRDMIGIFTSAKLMADRQTSGLDQAALADFIAEGHLERQSRRMRRLYKQRRETLCESLRRYFGSAVTILGDAAGMHLMARFADSGIDQRARRQGIKLESAAKFYASAPPANEFIIGFASVPDVAIRSAIRRLAS